MWCARAVAVVGTAATVLLVAGCGGADAPSVSTTMTTIVTPSDPVTAEPTESTATVTETTTRTAAPTGTLPTEQAPSHDAQLSVTGVRIGQHDGFDRVVFDLAGTGTPGWLVRFTDDPRRDGSGEPVEIDGRRVIEVIITGIGYPGDTGAAPFIGVVDGQGGITAVDVAGPFEGQAVAFIGSAAENPGVRVSALSTPTRLVVDIAH